MSPSALSESATVPNHVGIQTAANLEDPMLPFSVLDLAPVPEGSTVSEALANSVDLARHVEGLGYHRFWLAEHHNMPGIASAATSILIGQVAAATHSLRVGAGGVMLPNHAPLMIAEQFGTLACLFPGRIDLGVGRAPGTDMATARALRRHLDAADTFPQDVQELMGYFEDASPGGVQAFPGAGTHVPVWILGSSLFGARLAAHLGLPYAFASHFAPAALSQALHIYRSGFRPSKHLDQPRFMLAVNVIAGEDDAEGRYLRTSLQLAIAALTSGRPSRLPRPTEDINRLLTPTAMATMEQMFSFSAVGGPDTVHRQLKAMIDTHRPDEVIVTGQIHDHSKRLRSFEIAADALRAIGGTPA